VALPTRAPSSAATPSRPGQTGVPG